MARTVKGTLQSPLADLDLRLLDWLAIPASLHDANGRFVYTNAAAERASGHSNDWFAGLHFTELLPPEARENVSAQFRRAVERGEPTDFETAFIDASGQLRGTLSELGAHTRVEAIAEARRLGLLAPPPLRPPRDARC